MNTVDTYEVMLDHAREQTRAGLERLSIIFDSAILQESITPVDTSGRPYIIDRYPRQKRQVIRVDAHLLDVGENEDRILCAEGTRGVNGSLTSLKVRALPPKADEPKGVTTLEGGIGVLSVPFHTGIASSLSAFTLRRGMAPEDYHQVMHNRDAAIERMYQSIAALTIQN